MKIPLVYPKIPEPKNCPLKQCIAFEKLDGTNIHWKWNSDKGFYAFGTRRDQFPTDADGTIHFQSSHEGLEPAPSSFDHDFYLDNYLSDHSKYNKSELIIFTEFFGPTSFAGSHFRKDEWDDYKSVIIDVMKDGKFIPPQEFLDDFTEISEYKPAQVHIPKVVYKGKYTGQFVEDVRNGKYNVNEGVVVKGVVDGEVYMTKIKTNAYMEKLKSEFKDNWKDYWE